MFGITVAPLIQLQGNKPPRPSEFLHRHHVFVGDRMSADRRDHSCGAVAPISDRNQQAALAAAALSALL
jgi:hypothetical protein